MIIHCTDLNDFARMCYEMVARVQFEAFTATLQIKLTGLLMDYPFQTLLALAWRTAFKRLA